MHHFHLNATLIVGLVRIICQASVSPQLGLCNHRIEQARRERRECKLPGRRNPSYLVFLSWMALESFSRVNSPVLWSMTRTHSFCTGRLLPLNVVCDVPELCTKIHGFISFQRPRTGLVLFSPCSRIDLQATMHPAQICLQFSPCPPWRETNFWIALNEMGFPQFRFLFFDLWEPWILLKFLWLENHWEHTNTFAVLTSTCGTFTVTPLLGSTLTVLDFVESSDSGLKSSASQISRRWMRKADHCNDRYLRVSHWRVIISALFRGFQKTW